MKKEKTKKSLESTLWEACNKLRGSMTATDYMYFTMGLVFLKLVDLKFEKRREELLNSEDKDLVEIPSFYLEKNVFFIPEKARYSYIVKNSKANNIGILVDDAFDLIEKENESLKGALPKIYAEGVRIITPTKFSSLIDVINDIEEDEDHPMVDIIGKIYQYFLNKFSVLARHEKGEFYTPDPIVDLITTLIEPYSGKIYDPCCGTGGMFVQSEKFVEAHQGNMKNVSIYGQESEEKTWKLAKMNLAIRGINANLGENFGDTFFNDMHKTTKFDYIIANPPFNKKGWREENQLLDDVRWEGYAVPPVSNMNYAWILHMLNKLSKANKVAGFLLANGALNADGEEYKIRKNLIINHKIEAIIVLPREMFYHVPISVTLWIMRNNKEEGVIFGTEDRKVRNRQEEILFMDLRAKGHYNNEGYIEFAKEEIEEVKKTYFCWQSKDDFNKYKDIPEYCKSVKEKDLVDFSLIPSKYIEFIDHDLDIDYEKEMNRIKKEMKDLLKEEKESQKELLDAFKGIGYEIS